ncbi:MAG: hypothetical protein WCN87_01215, partial [Chlamydiota bacterium]
RKPSPVSIEGPSLPVSVHVKAPCAERFGPRRSFTEMLLAGSADVYASVAAGAGEKICPAYECSPAVATVSLQEAKGAAKTERGTFTILYRGVTYAPVPVALKAGSSLYRLDETRVLRLLKTVDLGGKKEGPAVSSLENVARQIKGLQENRLPFAAVENDLLVDFFLVQSYIKGPHLSRIMNLEGHNKAIADVIKAFIEHSFWNKFMIDLRLENFIIDEKRGLPVLVKFYEDSIENIDEKMADLLTLFLPAFCGDSSVARYLTQNLETLAPFVYADLKDRGLSAYLPESHAEE